MASFFCYILECSDGTFYTGWTTDPERRAKQHNAGRGARYTRQRRPVRLIYIEPQPDRNSAMKRERAIKTLSHPQKKALAERYREEQNGNSHKHTASVASDRAGQS